MFRLLTFLGTSSGTPTPYRNVSAACLSLADGRVWMVDCGEGTQHQLLRCNNVSVSKIEKVFITHLHGDHCYGLPGMLCSMSLLWTAPGVVPNATYALKKAAMLAGAAAATAGQQDKAEPVEVEEAFDEETFVFDHFSKTSEFLEIYGPFGTAAYLREVLRSSETRFGFRYRVTEFMYGRDPSKASSSVDASSSAKKTAVAATDAPTHIVVEEMAEVDGVETIECEAPVRRLHVPPALIEAAEAKEKAKEKTNTKPVSVFDGYSFSVPAAVLDPSGGFSLRAAWLDHPVPSLGYSLTEPETAGTLDMKKATALGVPKGPLLAKLKKGEAVTFDVKAAGADNSQTTTATVTVHPSDVVGPPIAGRKLTMLGDTSNSDRMAVPIQPIESSGEEEKTVAESSTASSSSVSLGGVAGGSDWLVHESTFDDASSHLALPRGHSTARMAGAFARSVGAKALIITHFSARYPPEEKDPQPIEALRRQAVEGLEGSSDASPSRDADVIAAHDFLAIDLSRAAGGKLKKFAQL